MCYLSIRSLKTLIILPVIKSHTNILASSKPDITQLPCELISNDTVLQDGFHFLNKVPLCKSYTTMKLGFGSSIS